MTMIPTRRSLCSLARFTVASRTCGPESNWTETMRKTGGETHFVALMRSTWPGSPSNPACASPPLALLDPVARHPGAPRLVSGHLAVGIAVEVDAGRVLLAAPQVSSARQWRLARLSQCPLRSESGQIADVS